MDVWLALSLSDSETVKVRVTVCDWDKEIVVLSDFVSLIDTEVVLVDVAVEDML